MKKKRNKSILFLTILALMVIIPMILPESEAKLIKINENTITKIDENLEGKIYKYGTPIEVDVEYYIKYYSSDGEELASMSNYPTSPSPYSYVGGTYYSVDLSTISQYWKITNIYSNCSLSGIEIEMKPVKIEKFNDKECNLDNIEIGSICKHNSEIISEMEKIGIIEYLDKNNQKIGQTNNIYTSATTKTNIGYIQGESLIDITNAWELVDIDEGSVTFYTFKPTDSIKDGDVEFSLNCDKEKINYQEKTTCHINVKNYIITQDEIILELKNQEDLNITKIIQNDIFKVTNNNNNMTINSNYFSTTPEDVELFSFEVQAKKDKNEVNNIEIQNIQYYKNETYNNIKTTIEINNTSPKNNPLTQNQTIIIKIILIITGLLISTSLLLKKKSV